MTKISDPEIPFPEWHLSPTDAHAWWKEMYEWVTRLRADYEHLWPPHPVVRGHRQRRSFPHCWPYHRALVRFLSHLRDLESLYEKAPLTEQTTKGKLELHILIEETLANYVQTIAEYCSNGHKGPEVVKAKRIDLTGKARVHWADSLADPPPAPPAPPPHTQPPRRPYKGPTTGEGLS